MDKERWDRVKAGSARVCIMEMEPGRYEVIPEKEVRG